MSIDVAIIGGGPAGLSAALVLGRARKKVVVFDAGPRRNAAASHVNGFVTRDGIAPAEFRAIAREQLRAYPSVEVRDIAVEAITREGERFHVATAAGPELARRVLLTVGMTDELPKIEGFRELWGATVFQCPYCHAWELRDRRFGNLVPSLEMLEWVSFLKGWTSDVTAFTNAAFAVPDEARARLDKAGVRLEERRITALRGHAGQLTAVVLEGGGEVALDALTARPRQRQTALVSALGLALDDMGYVRIGPQHETSIPSLFAAGDLTTMGQSALVAAAAGSFAAAMLNHKLTADLVAEGLL